MFNIGYPVLAYLLSLTGAAAAAVPADDAARRFLQTDVLILGGGMTGVSAAHTLHNDLGITNLLIVEARHELGGRVQNGRIGGVQVELGANWIEGLGENPIWKLAQKFRVANQRSDWEDISYFTKDGWEDEGGPLQEALTRYEEEVFIAASADAGRRKEMGMPDLSMKAGLVLVPPDSYGGLG